MSSGSSTGKGSAERATAPPASESADSDESHNNNNQPIITILTICVKDQASNEKYRA